MRKKRLMGARRRDLSAYTPSPGRSARRREMGSRHEKWVFLGA